MIYLLLTCLVLCLAVVVHSFSAWMQRRFKIYSHLGPMAWSTHQFVIAPAWLVFFVMSTQIGEFAKWPMPVNLPEIGWLLLLIALFLMTSALAVMDIQVLTNGWLFGQGPRRALHEGIYKYLANPFYDGLSLVYIAAAFITNNAAFLVVGLAMHGLLNHLQAKLENIADSLVK
jgi:protein-S-isoprenylcysteine O-methyltransferase Ste14